MRFVSYKDRKRIAAAMRDIYTATTIDTAEIALNTMNNTWGEQYPGVIDVWRHAWNEFIPFLEYPPELRKVVYTTNPNPSTTNSARSPRPADTSPETKPP
jgi:transposase-like protein